MKQLKVNGNPLTDHSSSTETEKKTQSNTEKTQAPYKEPESSESVSLRLCETEAGALVCKITRHHFFSLIIHLIPSFNPISCSVKQE